MIHPETSIGAVHLRVLDLARAVAFHGERLGFTVRTSADRMAALGAGGEDLLVLHETARAPKPGGTTGLYHFAILLPSRRDLARALRHLVVTGTRLDGASDHLVSEALYLRDPEGNGIEVYRDRPLDAWPRENGQVRLATEPLDLEALLADAGPDTGDAWRLPPGTAIGHVHLQVSDLDRTEQFYREILGFEVTQRLAGSATFLAAGGYHHHIGLNVWAGAGAPPPPADAAGLDRFVVSVPDAAEVMRIVERCRVAQWKVEEIEGETSLRDPSGNRLTVEVRKPG